MLKRITLIILSCLAFNLYALQPGKDYLLTNVEPLTEDPSKVEVREFFWYGCPHCYDFESPLTTWLEEKKDDKSFYFVRSPVQFRPGWQQHAKAYYTSIALGKDDVLHPAIFKSIHEKNQYLSTESELASFFGQFEVEEEKFSKAFNSFGVATGAKQANALAIHYRVTQVPTVVINGKYKVTSTMSGSFEEFLNVIERLVEKEKEALQAQNNQ